MYCTRCGHELEDDDRFCTYCGAPVDTPDDDEDDWIETPEGALAKPMVIPEEVLGDAPAGSAVPQGGPETWDDGAGDRAAPVSAPQTSASPSKATSARNSKALLAIICIIVAVAVFLAVLLLGGAFRGSSSPDEGGQASTGTEDSGGTQADGGDAGSAPATSEGAGGASQGTTSATDAGSSQNKPIPQGNAYASYTADYIIPDSDVRVLSESELAGYNKDQLRLARNEIYARHGRIFNDAELAEYFGSKHWYHPSIPAATFDENQQEYLSSTEYENANTILAYEKAHGYR